MSVLVWNCRGVRNPHTVQDLDALVRRYNPTIVFLSETMVMASRVKQLKWRLGLKGALAVDSDEKHGGITLFWHESIQVDLLEQGEQFFDVLITESPEEAPWRATFIYGEPRVEDRYKTWEILQRLKSRSNEAWMVAGDFNEAMWQFEHFSETKRGERQMAHLREVLAECDLRDLGFSGTPWTYDNKKRGRSNVKVRLDRGVANSQWMGCFFDASVQHLASSCSDHCPILIRA